jgi:hypothetical protein
LKHFVIKSFCFVLFCLHVFLILTFLANGGTVFSTFPLSASMPFHIHIQAPWLLDLSRKV